MPELRKDPIVGRWVIINTERVRRPHDFKLDRKEPSSGPCPFCPGEEARTPAEILAYRPSDVPGLKKDGPGWSVRVFPNKYPALVVEGALNREGEGVYDRMNGIGAHEVVVETNDHNRQLAQLGEPEIENVLWAYRDRMLDLKKDPRFKYIMVFKNYGDPAGATVDHSHSQLIALPVVPTNVVEEMNGALEYFEYKERCVFCDIVKQEVTHRSRLVYENSDFIVIQPFAPKLPFETWVLPRAHRSAYEDCQHHEYAGLANAMSVALKKLHVGLEDPPYNFMLHTSPIQQKDNAHYHWHIEIMPALGRVAGFEWGSGFYINPTPPEDAARFLREIDV